MTGTFDEARKQVRGQTPRGIPARVCNQVTTLRRRKVEVGERERGREGRPAHQNHVLGVVNAPLSLLTHEGEGTRHGRGGHAGQHARGIDAGHTEHGDRHIDLRCGLGAGGNGGCRVRVVHEDLGLRLPGARRGCTQEQASRRIVVLGTGGTGEQEVIDQGRCIGVRGGTLRRKLDAAAVLGGHIEGGRGR